MVAPAVATRCGGQLPYGFLDDAGVYHAGDGAVLFRPGSACMAWDASHLDDPPPRCDASDQCTAWYEGVTPPGFPTVAGSCGPDPALDGATRCYPEGVVPLPSCPALGPAGDQLCAAWAQQFIARPGWTAAASCAFGSYGLGCTIGPVDDAGSATLVCIDDQEDPTGLYVTTDAGPMCEPPCQP